MELWAVTLSGDERRLWHESGQITLLDVSSDGRLLLSRLRQERGDGRSRLRAGEEARYPSWLDWSLPVGLSEDGRTVLFIESGEGAGPARAVYARNTDGSPAVHLGEGRGLALSPDTKTALASSADAHTLLLLPIGAGASRSIALFGLTVQMSASFFPDGRRLAFAANEEDLCESTVRGRYRRRIAPRHQRRGRDPRHLRCAVGFARRPIRGL